MPVRSRYSQRPPEEPVKVAGKYGPLIDTAVDVVQTVAPVVVAPAALRVSELGVGAGVGLDKPMNPIKAKALEKEFRKGLKGVGKKSFPVNPVVAIDDFGAVPSFYGMTGTDYNNLRSQLKGRMTGLMPELETMLGRGDGAMATKGTSNKGLIKVDPMFALDTPTGPNTGHLIYPATTTAHEMGHALDFQTPLGRKVMKARSSPKLKGAGPIPYIAATLMPTDGDLMAETVVGGVSSLVSPKSMATMLSELRADKFGADLAKRAGTTFSQPSRLLTRASYGAVPFAKGAAQGFAGGVINLALSPVVDFAASKGSEGLVRGLDAVTPGGFKRDGRDLHFDTDRGYMVFTDTGEDARMQR
jgi:hypothetical protein